MEEINKEKDKVREMERIREKKNREEQKAALEQYRKEAEKEAERQKAEMQEKVNQIIFFSFVLTTFKIRVHWSFFISKVHINMMVFTQTLSRFQNF